jgi:F1F0 ATPase subunit 2
MGEFWQLAASLAGGILLGAMFFGGLWWTVTRGLSSEQPALWFLGSMLARMAITMAGFYVIGRGDWQRWLLCLVGFVLARFMVKWLTRAPEASHAS